MVPSERNNVDLDRLPPNDYQAERAVLSGLILNNETIHEVIGVLQASDFFTESHKIIFDGIMKLYEDDSPFDLITLKHQIEKDGNLAKVGSSVGLAEVMDSHSSVANVKFYADIVKEKAQLRLLINAGQEIVSCCYNTDLDSKEIVNRAEQQVFVLSDQTAGMGLHHIESAANSAFEELKNVFQNGVSGISTGFHELDRMTTGLHEGELIIVAGRPSMGKTSFGLNIASYIAKNYEKYGAAILLFSLEMVRSQLATRFLGTEACIDGIKLRKGDLSERNWESILDSLKEISNWPIYIDDTPDISVMEIRSVARRLAKKVNVGLILVDYIQLLRADRKTDSRQMEITQISRSLKFLAKELKCPVIALSQLSRAVESRTIKRPQLSDLRESGAIEQDADVVFMLYRPEYYKETEVTIDGQSQNAEGMAEVIIAKQRNGPVGSFYLGFQKSLMQFINIDKNVHVPHDISAE
ncbi:replicative DNA helicase [bacterium]|nr:replicative DNA helicase [bacterium]